MNLFIVVVVNIDQKHFTLNVYASATTDLIYSIPEEFFLYEMPLN